MVFSSYIFIFYFFPFALLVYYLSPRRFRHLGLTILSYVFYGWSNPLFVPLMFGTTLIDYLAGMAQAHNGLRGWRRPIEILRKDSPRTRKQKLILAISITSNLSLLGFFKYFNFGIQNYNMFVGLLRFKSLQANHVTRIVLPLGISFYTFQSMSYAIDVYRGEAKAMRSFTDFACYVSLFPQLVAGPIIRFADVADQLASRSHTLSKFSRGIAIFCLGMAEKILIADTCGKIADLTFNAGALRVLDAWFGAVAYAFQIYFDFGGYSSMAIGLGLMLGFVFAKNFDMPYKAESITDFWRRWHISLSTWLRDYLYFPLGGNRKGKLRTYINLMLVMLLGGLWHGAAWNYVIWGGIHGFALTTERALGKASVYYRLPKLCRIALTFAIVLIAWVFFRSSDLRSSILYLRSMCGLGLGSGYYRAGLLEGILYKPYYVVTLIIAGSIAWGAPDVWRWTQKLTLWKAAICLFLFGLSLIILMTTVYRPFIYFIF